jgi:SWI/SNF-related matrix-associated actin-dependent regulator of chromatin subfamily D
MDSSYRVKIEGRLLDEEDDDLGSEDSEDEEETTHGDAMDEDGKGKPAAKSKIPTKQYKFSHFFKAMTVDFDRSKGKEGGDQSVEWKKPVVAPNAANLPNAADFDQLEFKQGGDENTNITINLLRDENPERFQLSPQLADILDTDVATRAEAVMGVWEYIKAMGLQEDDEKRSFDCDDRLRAVSKLAVQIRSFALTCIASATRQRIYPIPSRLSCSPHDLSPTSQTPLHYPS